MLLVHLQPYLQLVTVVKVCAVFRACVSHCCCWRYSAKHCRRCQSQ